MFKAEGIQWEEGWEQIESKMAWLITAFENGVPPQITPTDYISVYELIYKMCVQHRPCEHSAALYGGYKHIISSYYLSKVLPALTEKCNELLLKEFTTRWSNHKELSKWLSRFFGYLDRYFVVRHGFPTLSKTGDQIFFDLVYEKVKSQLRDAVLYMIHREREGEQIDEYLLRKIIAIYFDMGSEFMKFYELDFEDAMLKYTAAYYFQKTGTWIVAHSYTDYMHKAYECMKQEEERALKYLHFDTRPKLLETVKHELFAVHARQLDEKKQYDGLASRTNEEELMQVLLPKYASLAI